MVRVHAKLACVLLFVVSASAPSAQEPEPSQENMRLTMQLSEIDNANYALHFLRQIDNFEFMPPSKYGQPWEHLINGAGFAAMTV